MSAALRMSLRRLAAVFAVVLLTGASCRCGKKTKNEVVVYTSVDQPFSEPVLKDFEKRTGIRVRVVYDTEETKSTGILNRLLAEAKHPQADVFWSGDPVRPQVLIRRGLVASYRPPSARDIPARFRDARGRWFGFSARVRVLLVNTKRVDAAQMPRSILDLTQPRWKGRVAIANPAFGTTTMHVAALFARWGSRRAGDFMAALRKNDVKVASSNGEVKRLVIRGEVDWGLVDTDDAAVAVRAGAPVKVVYPDAHGLGVLVMPTVAVMIQGGGHPANARRLLEYLASHRVEQRLAFAPCAQLPLRGVVRRPAGLPDLSTLRAMPVDFARLGRIMDRIHPYLRDWAAGKTGITPPSLPGARR